MSRATKLIFGKSENKKTSRSGISSADEFLVRTHYMLLELTFGPLRRPVFFVESCPLLMRSFFLSYVASVIEIVILHSAITKQYVAFQANTDHPLTGKTDKLSASMT